MILNILKKTGLWLQAERDQWALWLPVFLGMGLAVYFSLPFEPPLSPFLAILLALGLAFWVGRGKVLDSHVKCNT